MDTEIRALSSFLHLIILPIIAHVTSDQGRVWGQQYLFFCFYVVWLLFEGKRYILYSRTQRNLIRDTCTGYDKHRECCLLNDRNVLMNGTSVVCD